MKPYLPVFLCAFFLHGAAQSAAITPPKSASVKPPKNMSNTDQTLDSILTHPSQALASLSVLAIKGGKVVYERQFGRSYINEADATKEKININTTFPVDHCA